MVAKSRNKAENSSLLHSTRLHVIMYSMLLVMTPYILLQNFLVEIISKISSSTIEIAGFETPVLPYLALILLIAFLIIFRSRVTKIHIIAGAVAILMFGLAQQFTDYYLDRDFYELQQNWHYFAYGIFAFFMYRDLAPRGVSMTRIILITFVAALLFSLFDESFQKFMSSRIFDISDTAKDVWGALTGIVTVYLVKSRPNNLRKKLGRIRYPKFSEYINNPFSLLFLLFILTLIFLLISSLFTDFRHLSVVTILTIGSFVAFFILLHLSQFRWIKYILIIILLVGISAQTYFFVKYRNDNIVYNKYGLTVYKGIPLFYVDIMILPNGMINLVDKKHYFYNRDIRYFLKKQTDIVIIGSGNSGLGGKGFSGKTTQFVYNAFTHRATQVIVMKTHEACKLFNKLKREQKNVLFVLHNTC